MRQDNEGLRGRILLVFQDSWRNYLAGKGAGETAPWCLSVAAVAREMGVSRQRVYRACPEFIAR